jgi:3-methylcrotonyl-CoA carboxylase beta subunit
MTSVLLIAKATAADSPFNRGRLWGAGHKKWIADEEAQFKKPILENFEREGHPYFATARIWDDGIIAPRETRRVVTLSLSAALNAPIPDMRFGVFRM